MGLRGRATVLPALAAAIERWRCRGHPANFAKRGHIRSGAPLGRVSVGLLPAAATGRAGTVTWSSPAWISETPAIPRR